MVMKTRSSASTSEVPTLRTAVKSSVNEETGGNLSLHEGSCGQRTLNPCASNALT